MIDGIVRVMIEDGVICVCVFGGRMGGGGVYFVG